MRGVHKDASLSSACMNQWIARLTVPYRTKQRQKNTNRKNAVSVVLENLTILIRRVKIASNFNL